MGSGKIKYIATLVILVLILFANFTASAKTIYVKSSAPPSGSGTSWSDAYNSLQSGLNDADPCDQIWIAAGTYYPTTKVGGTSDRYKTFQMKNYVAIYGGFPNTGDPCWPDRDPSQYETILSGDLLANDDPCTPLEDLLDDPCRADNAYHVFFHTESEALDSTALLDGFTITAGNADGAYPHIYGGGMHNSYCSPTVTHCFFTANSVYEGGGGMYNHDSSPAMTNCTFTHNSATEYGGGMYNLESGSPKVTTCTFTGNSAGNGGGMSNYCCDSIVTDCIFTDNSSGSGGGMGNIDSHPTVINCIFSANLAYYYGWGGGGGISNELYSSPTITNCTFLGNLADNGGGIYSEESFSYTVKNCIFSGNSATNGGGMHNAMLYSTPTVTNCTFSGNSATTGGGMYNIVESAPTITNCIFWGNTATNYNEIYTSSIPLVNPVISYSDIAGCGGSGPSWDTSLGEDGGGNIDTNPLFVNSGNYHLKSQAGRWNNSSGWVNDTVTSPCIDAGDPSSAWTGELWPHGGRINMGAYGGTTQASMSLNDSVGNVADLNYDGLVSMQDFSLFAQKYPIEEILLVEDMNRDGKVDTIDLSILADQWLMSDF